MMTKFENHKEMLTEELFPFMREMELLENEYWEIDEKVLAELINKHYLAATLAIRAEIVARGIPPTPVDRRPKPNLK